MKTVDTQAARELAESIGYMHGSGEEVRLWIHNLCDEIERLRKNAAVPPGLVLVPADPPREMMEAGDALPAICESDIRLRRLGWSLMACQNRRRYLAMLAAVPKP